MAQTLPTLMGWHGFSYSIPCLYHLSHLLYIFGLCFHLPTSSLYFSQQCNISSLFTLILSFSTTRGQIWKITTERRYLIFSAFFFICNCVYLSKLGLKIIIRVGGDYVLVKNIGSVNLLNHTKVKDSKPY